MSNNSRKIIIVGGGVAGSEMGTLLGQRAKEPVEIIEIECDSERKFGGWGFQSFPESERTNLALRKMYLNEEDQTEILKWASDPANRENWPERYKDIKLDPNKIFPRVLVREYVKWRRSQVENDNVQYTHVTAEAMHVDIDKEKNEVYVTLDNGDVITGDRLVMASGSIAVKIPRYLQDVVGHDHVIPDPLTRAGDEARANIPLGSKVLILGTGLTGEEQVNVLSRLGHTDLTLLSREGKQHYSYPELQINKPLSLEERPNFLVAETPEEFQTGLKEFYTHYLNQGHSSEDILAAIRPHWEGIRAELGGCVKAVERLNQFKRDLAVNSIGTSFEVAAGTQAAVDNGHLLLKKGYIRNIAENDGKLLVDISEDGEAAPETIAFDYIINAIGRTIIRHPIWEDLLKDGHANKHASIGVQVSEHGQMMDAKGEYSDLVYVVGMARAGDHTFRHGFLGNTAFNVPQVRAHCGKTANAILQGLSAPAASLKAEVGSTAQPPRYEI